MVTHVFDNSNLSQEIFAIDTWGAVICFLGHGRKHMLTTVRLHGNQAKQCMHLSGCVKTRLAITRNVEIVNRKNDLILIMTPEKTG